MPRVSRKIDRSRAARTATSAIKGLSHEARIGERIQPRADGCWIYNNDPYNYGWVTCGLRGTQEPAHRYVYRTLRFDIPDGMHLHHKCFNKGCVNPFHLEAMTPSDHISLHAQLRQEAECHPPALPGD